MYNKILKFSLSLMLTSICYAGEIADNERSTKAFVLFNMPTTNVLVSKAERPQFGPTAFSEAVMTSFGPHYNDALYDERIRRFHIYFKADEDFTFLDNTEEMYMANMIESLKNIEQYSHPHGLEKNPFYLAACQKFTRAASLYLEHRIKGVRRHLNTGNVNKSYEHMRRSFPEHKEQQELAMERFERHPDVMFIKKYLAHLAPSLKISEQDTIRDLLIGPRNYYDNLLTEFNPPPCLNTIKTVLSTLTSFSKWQEKYDLRHITAHRLVLQDSIDRLFQIQSFRLIEPYFKLHAFIESIVQAPLDITTWTSYQKDHWKNLPQGLLMFIGKFLPYKYVEIDENQVKEKRKILGRKTSTSEDRVEARRYLQHFFIQWPKLKQLGLLAFHAKKLERPYHFDILLGAAEELIPELENKVLPEVESWLNFEMAAAIGRLSELENVSEAESSPDTPTLKTLSNYAADVAYLTKLDETLSELEKIDSLPTEATLRVLTILGEVSKNLSDYTKKQFDTDNCLSQLAKMRNMTHHSRLYLRKLTKILKETDGLENRLLIDFKSLAVRVRAVLPLLPKTWDTVKSNYNNPPAPIEIISFKGILELLELADSDISREDYQVLFATKSSRVTELGQRKKIILEAIVDPTAALSINKDEFEAHLKGLTPLTSNEKRKISEFYKKLRVGGRVSSMIKTALDLVNKGLKKELSPDELARFNKFKLLFEDTTTIPSEEETTWVEFIKGLYPEKADQNKIVSGIRALYDPKKINKEEIDEGNSLRKLLDSDKFAEKTDSELDVELKKLIRDLKKITTKTSDSPEKDIRIAEKLSSELDRLRITDKKPWELVCRKIHAKHAKPASSEDKEKTPMVHIKGVLKDSMTSVSNLLEHLKQLDQLTLEQNGHLGRVDLNVFCRTPRIHLSAAYHIELIRQYADVIEEAIYYLTRHDVWSPYTKALSEFYHFLSIKLHNIRLTGNEFAHLHDVTEAETRTPYGIKYSLFGKIFDHVDGVSDRQGRNILPSLRQELENYATILKPYFDSLVFPDIISTKSSKTSSKVFNVIFNYHPVKLEEQEILGDGNCGFTGLGLTRGDSIERLITQLPTNTDLAAMVQDDVREAFRGRDLPPKLMRRFYNLATQLDDQDAIITGILADLNDQYVIRQREVGDPSPKRLTADEMMKILTEMGDVESLGQRDLLLGAQKQREIIQQNIWDQLSTPELLIEFLREEFLDGGRYLSYVRGNRGTLYALAHMENFEVHIWTLDQASGNLVESFTVPARIPGAPSNILHLYHTNYGSRLNHFNLLSVVTEPTVH